MARIDMAVAAAILRRVGTPDRAYSVPASALAETQVVIVLCFSFVAFALAEGLGLSGIVSSLSGGIFAALYCRANMNTRS